ncbi:hypothetical protein V2J09_010039 [Rumex salicifolius]
MADEYHYASGADSNKRKYDDSAALSTPSPERTGRRRPTGFSSPHAAPSGIESAKQRAQEIASRLFNDAEAKRPKFDNGGYDSAPDIQSAPKPPATNVHVANPIPSLPDSYGYQSITKKIDIPNGRVGVIIGKGGETIKYLQLQSGAKIQVTRDMDADPNSFTRTVDLVGSPDQIAKAEQLIGDVLAEAEAGGSAVVSRRMTGQVGSEQFSMMVPNNKVGLVIGKGGETIKSIQARSGARVQVIPLHPPPGDTSTERTVQIDGSAEQVEAAKQLVNEVISEPKVQVGHFLYLNRPRNPSMGGGYSQQGYQARPPTSWGSRPPQMQQPQQPGYGYSQPGAYPGSQYGAPPSQYPSYPQQTGASGYPTNWDQSSTAPTQQQPPQATGYDYYNQPQQPQQPPTGDNSYYGYNNQPPTSGYSSTQQSYPQDAYGGGYQTSAPSVGYSQAPPNPSDQQGYGNPAKPPSDGHTPSYGTQGPVGQAPPPTQASPLAQPGYANQPPTQGDYGTAYGAPPPPQGQKPPYGQPQLSPSQGYVNPQGPPPAQSGYAQLPPSSYGAYQGYGAPPAYGQQPPPYAGGSYGGPYSQAPVYPAGDGNAASNGAGASLAAEPNAASKAPAPESK